MSPLAILFIPCENSLHRSSGKGLLAPSSAETRNRAVPEFPRPYAVFSAAICDEDLGRALIAGERVELVEVESHLDDQIDDIIQAIETRQMQQAEEISSDTFRRIGDMEEPHRETIYQQVVREEIDIHYATECAEALRWLTRVSRHISRICYYLNKSQIKSA